MPHLSFTGTFAPVPTLSFLLPRPLSPQRRSDLPWLVCLGRAPTFSLLFKELPMHAPKGLLLYTLSLTGAGPWDKPVQFSSVEL